MCPHVEKLAPTAEHAERVTPEDNRWAAALRGPSSKALRTWATTPLSSVLAVLWAQRSRTPWSAIGYVRPRSWARTILLGTFFGVALKLAMKSVIMPLLGAPPINSAYQFLVGNTPAMLGMIWVMIVVAGWGEETLFRGYLFERLGKWLGSSVWAKALIVVVTSVLFGSLHYREQGLAGAEQALLTGLTFGTIFAITGRLWPLVVAHAAYDLAAVWIIYTGLERNVAHWFFR